MKKLKKINRQRVASRLFMLNYLLLGRFGRKSLFFRIANNFYRILMGAGLLMEVRVDLNNACNLNCSYCYLKKSDDNLELDVVKKLIGKISGRVMRVDIIGGEPLLREDIFEILRYCTERIPKVILFTNGTLVDQDVAKKIKDSKVNGVIVSIKSIDSKEHDRITGVEGSFEKAMNGIKNLKEAGANTYVYMALSRRNIADIEKIFKFSEEQKVKLVLHKYSPTSKNDEMNPVDNKVWYKVKKRIKDRYQKHFKKVKNVLLINRRVCNGGYNQLSVKSNGDVTPCIFLDDPVIGNIKERSIFGILKDAIHNNKELKEFLKIPEDCKDCSIGNICRGGCRLANKTLCGSYSKRDNLCLGPWSVELDEDKLIDHIPYWW